MLNSKEGYDMGDVWDYKLRRMGMVWELALRVIPQKPELTGKWHEGKFFEEVQKTLQEASKVVNAVFNEDKP